MRYLKITNRRSDVIHLSISENDMGTDDRVCKKLKFHERMVKNAEIQDKYKYLSINNLGKLSHLKGVESFINNALRSWRIWGLKPNGTVMYVKPTTV